MGRIAPLRTNSGMLEMFYAEVFIVFSFFKCSDFNTWLYAMLQSYFDHFFVCFFDIFFVVCAVPSTAHAVIGRSELYHIYAWDRADFFDVIHCFFFLDHESFYKASVHCCVIHLF